jgi:ribosomal protein S12 methylthiotransferase accessory factor
MQRILARLDGTYDFVRLLGDQSTEEAFYALRMLASFAQSGLLAEGPISVHAPLRSAAIDVPVRLDGITLVTLNAGLFSAALGRSLKAFGGTVQRGTLADARACGAVAVACLEGPDFVLLHSINTLARAIGTTWLPVFPFGDGIIVGPLFRPASGPCFRCFELRWLGISPSIALELAYFAHLRAGAFRDRTALAKRQVERLARQVSSIVADKLVDVASAQRVALIHLELATVNQTILEASPECNVCAACQAPGTKPDPEHLLNTALWFDSPLPLAELALHLAELGGEPCGLASISSCATYAKNGNAQPLEIVVARFALPAPESVGGAQDNWCHGAAILREDARTLALVEALERYSGLSHPAPGIWTNYTNVCSKALLPTELTLFSDAEYARPEFPFQAFDPDRIMRWNWGYNLTLKRSVLVPTSAVWYGYDDSLLGESSNGVAAHSSRGHALLNAVLELVERDAFMIHWLHRLSPPHVDPDSTHDDRSHAMIGCIEKGGYAVHIVDITTDLEIPVALALGVRVDRRKPALIVGAGASLDHRGALFRALSELYAATFSPTELWSLPPLLDPADVVSLADHSRAYAHPDWLQHAAFLWASNRQATWPKPSQADSGCLRGLTTLVERLQWHGYNVIGVDITPRDIARYRLFVVRAIVPGLQPLALGTRRRLGGRRLYEVPVRMGYRDALPREKDLNPTPHCFP